MRVRRTHLRSEGAVEAIGRVVRQLDPGNGSASEVAGVEHHEPRLVVPAAVQLRDHPAVVLLPVPIYILNK